MAASEISDMPSRGFIYVATGVSYVEEAVKSACSFKAAMPATPICLFTDQPEIGRRHDCFDEIREITEPEFGPNDKFNGLKNSPFDHTVFLDTDTWCLDQVDELFRLLERFEFAAAHAPVRAMNMVPAGVPRTFPELNTGVLAFRRCPPVTELFERWQSDYLDFRKRREIKRDQLSFRKALYFSSVNLTILPPEYNLRTVFSYFVGGMAPVKIVHARGKELKQALKIVENGNATMSIYPYVVHIDRQ